MNEKQLLTKRAEEDLEFFINLVHPGRVLGTCHRDVINWWTKEGAASHQLLLLPRDHQKSALMAYRAAWEITRNPAVRILYLSATSTLAVKQLDFIKEILTCDSYRFYWPEMVHKNKNSRRKWTETEIAVDHPLRAKEAIRDSTIFTGGLTTTITGLHCDIAFLDDVVVESNAYNQAGRDEVSTQMSYFSSIVGTEGRVYAAGTRYHPEDYYYEMINTQVDMYDHSNNKIGTYPLYEVYERGVEDRGDGTGNFLWPRTQRSDGKSFGFNKEILAVKRASYKDNSKFRAQYYNDPAALGSTNFSRDQFQYYDRSLISIDSPFAYYLDRRLNVFASIDFAYSTNAKADYSCVVVIGVDAFNNIYILDIDRFKTGKISDYFNRILSLHQKWGFRKINAEITAAQSVIVKDLKENHIRTHGLALSVVESRPRGNKEERIEAALQSRYDNRLVWHYTGGSCDILEEELLAARPAHDDVKDALSLAVEIAVPPTMYGMNKTKKDRFMKSLNNNSANGTRFGGLG